MSETTLFCTARSRARTQTILVRLNLAGFLYADMSVLKAGNDFNQGQAFMKGGLVHGGRCSGVFGLLSSIGSLDIPGMGSLAAAGPIMMAPRGATIRVGTGGIFGRLIWVGIPEDDARIYENKLKAGDYVIAVQTRNEEEFSRAREILESEGALNISMANQAGIPECA